MERMKLIDLSPKSSYIVYLTATVVGKNSKSTIKYEPLRIQHHPERFCDLFPNELNLHSSSAAAAASSSGNKSVYEFNRIY